MKGTIAVDVARLPFESGRAPGIGGPHVCADRRKKNAPRWHVVGFHFACLDSGFDSDCRFSPTDPVSVHHLLPFFRGMLPGLAIGLLIQYCQLKHSRRGIKCRVSPTLCYAFGAG